MRVKRLFNCAVCLKDTIEIDAVDCGLWIRCTGECTGPGVTIEQLDVVGFLPQILEQIKDAGNYVTETVIRREQEKHT